MDTAKEKSRTSFDRQAAHYDTSSDGAHARSLYPYLLEKLGPLSYRALLDVGCGTGEILAQITARENVTLAGIDLSANMIAAAKQKLGERADLRVGDAENLPWSNDSFDVIICLDSFHHYPNPRKVLAEMLRVTKANGRLILGDLWTPPPVRQFMNLILPLTKGGDVRVYSEKEICALLKENGFTAIQWEMAGESAYIVTAASPAVK
ncbi:MAG: class I SAM-dependent methyltransferase [Chloroflexi bacterium]|nr:class I SAM-dependent methyltransferase [Chloroflexota bacterium]